MLIEDATREQAPALAFLINLAGEGIPHYLWTGMAQDGEEPMEIGAQRAAREEGGFSYRNARVTVEGDELLLLTSGRVTGRLLHVGDLHFRNHERPEVEEWFLMDGERAGWWAVAYYGFLGEVSRRVE